MHLSRPIAIRLTLSAVLTVMNLLIGASALRSSANEKVFPLVIALVLFAAATLARVWRHAVRICAPANTSSGMSETTMCKAELSAYGLAALIKAFRREPRSERQLKQ